MRPTIDEEYEFRCLAGLRNGHFFPTGLGFDWGDKSEQYALYRMLPKPMQVVCSKWQAWSDADLTIFRQFIYDNQNQGEPLPAKAQVKIDLRKLRKAGPVFFCGSPRLGEWFKKSLFREGGMWVDTYYYATDEEAHQAGDFFAEMRSYDEKEMKASRRRPELDFVHPEYGPLFAATIFDY
jgi:hypothetical protein